MTLRPFFLTLVLTGCSGISPLVAHDNYNNYMTFEHPFTDQAEADVLRRAEGICQQTKQTAIRVERVCSLAKCATSYQCAARTDPSKSAR